jgi:hypothetical protein
VPDSVQAVWLAGAFTGLSADLAWDATDGATSYDVRVYFDGGATLVRTANVTATSYSYTSALATTDGGPQRSIYFTVTAKNGSGDAVLAPELHAVNPTPAPPVTMAAELTTDAPTENTYTLTWDDNTDLDFDTFKVYLSDVDGFTEGPSTLVYTGSANTTTVDIAKVFGGHGPQFWRVVALDVWGTEYRLSEQATIPAVAMTSSGFSSGFSTGFGG